MLTLLLGPVEEPAAQETTGTFRAAVVKVDITPGEPMVLQGFAPRTSEGVHDSLYHRIVAMDDGQTEFFLVSSDFVGFSPAYYDEVMRRL